jgi:hypothetical protein
MPLLALALALFNARYTAAIKSQNYPGEDVLLFADPKMQYGNAGWLVAVEEEAVDVLLEVHILAHSYTWLQRPHTPHSLRSHF